MVYGIISQAHREQDNFERLEETIKQPSAASDPVQPQEPSETDAASSPYAALKEQNPDFFNGEDSQSGVPFLSASCYEGCGNYLIYGHNMKSGSMFATLLAYADRDFWGQHPSIRFYQYTDLCDPDIFTEYMEQVQEAALYDTGINAKHGDSLLTISTCSYHTKNGRFVVVARGM